MQHVDSKKLNELETMLGSNYTHLMQTFIKNVDSTLQELSALCENRESHIAEIGRLAHNLKGTAGNVGASSMHKYAAQLDKLAKERDLTVMPELLTELYHAFEAFQSVVEKKAS